jgi:hypothetical protein
VAARRLGREVAVANETCAVQVYGRGDAVVSIRRIAEPGRAAGGRPAGRPPRAARGPWLAVAASDPAAAHRRPSFSHTHRIAC